MMIIMMMIVYFDVYLFFQMIDLIFHVDIVVVVVVVDYQVYSIVMHQSYDYNTIKYNNNIIISNNIYLCKIKNK